MQKSSLLVECQWSSHPRNVQFAREVAREVTNHYRADRTELIELAIGEACANAVEHGSPAGELSHFTLRCFHCENPAALVFEVEDEGQEFAITGLTTTHAPDVFSEGGRGLFLINQIMDEVILRGTVRGLNIRMILHLTPLSMPMQAKAVASGSAQRC